MSTSSTWSWPKLHHVGLLLLSSRHSGFSSKAERSSLLVKTCLRSHLFVIHGKLGFTFCLVLIFSWRNKTVKFNRKIHFKLKVVFAEDYDVVNDNFEDPPDWMLKTWLMSSELTLRYCLSWREAGEPERRWRLESKCEEGPFDCLNIAQLKGMAYRDYICRVNNLHSLLINTDIASSSCSGFTVWVKARNLLKRPFWVAFIPLMPLLIAAAAFK